MVALNSPTLKFSLGRVLATPAALAAIEAGGQTPQMFLRRHASGDWGQLSAEDAQANEDGLASGARLLSCYQTTNGVRIWIITEADRSATTLLLPKEY